MSDKVAILGYSGHGFVVIDAAITAGISLSDYCERNKVVENPFQLVYLGFEEDENFVGWEEQYQFILGIGNNHIRNKIAEKVLSHNKVLLNVVHPHCSISAYSKIGMGNFVAKQVSINAFAKIGNFCILNTGCIIEHECNLGNAVHIAPGAVLAGNVEVGEFSFIGANAVIKQGVKIGANVTVGAGTVIINDVLDNQTIVGNPGRLI
ncbi:MAG: acetyltransferase [Sphingobacteriaceae bacterium]